MLLFENGLLHSASPDMYAVQFDDSHREVWWKGKPYSFLMDNGHYFPAIYANYDSEFEYWIDNKPYPTDPTVEPHDTIEHELSINLNILKK